MSVESPRVPCGGRRESGRPRIVGRRGRRGRLRALSVLCGAVALLAPVGNAAGQGVTGVVREAETSAPLTGVLVSALSEDGARVGEALTGAEGRFRIGLDGGGGVRLRAERVGMATTTEWFDLNPTAPELVRRDLIMSLRGVEGERSVVTGAAAARTCEGRAGDALAVGRWWDEVRKALETTSLVQRLGLVRLRVYDFERDWDLGLSRATQWRFAPADRHTDGTGTVAEESGRWRRRRTSIPYETLDADALDRDGYIQGSRGSRTYYAPDADVLLSPSFLAGHCFSIAVARNRDHPEWLGLRFKPTRTRPEVDIAGTLWVDTTTSELRFVEYGYANLPADIPADHAGGRIDFRRLPSGAWIVSEWWIRMPMVAEARFWNKAEKQRHQWNSWAATTWSPLGYRDVGGRVAGADERVAPRRE